MKVWSTFCLFSVISCSYLLPKAYSFEAPDSLSPYVVQIHSTREGFVPSDDGLFETTFMTTESGQNFECFVPMNANNEQDDEDESDDVSLKNFGRLATKKIRPKCLQFPDPKSSWIYELCPSILLRRIRKNSRDQQDNTAAKEVSINADGTTSATAASASASASVKSTYSSPEIQDLGVYVQDSVEPLISTYKLLVKGDKNELETRLQQQQKPIYTQLFQSKNNRKKSSSIKVQFVCSPLTGLDQIAGITYVDQDVTSTKVTNLLVLSRLFCDSKFTDDPNHTFTVSSLLQPLVKMNTCIKRNEGWWTYEFCVGRQIRQYHRESDGSITAEFLLGRYDTEKNPPLFSSSSSVPGEDVQQQQQLVYEHIDATQETPRPAFLEYYGQGTPCNEFEVPRPRTTKVYYYCSMTTGTTTTTTTGASATGTSHHHILSVKETQTCSYTLKIASPVLCEHPHFINEEEKSEDHAEMIHCIPQETP